ncbi:MAG TPA: nuclear transport factor 2 family protein [Allosphingosinicella sp.]|nr:nuclear transport factor 2 family protein [Allosphingosinicella sp.]
MDDDFGVRVARLEAEAAIRRVASRYMALCDEPATDLPGLAFDALFTADLVWEGTGSKASGEFGRVEGRDRLLAWFDTMRTPPRYMFNVHFLTSEAIDVDVDADAAIGTWVMFQFAVQHAGIGELRIARLRIRFRIEEREWRICHFQTESLFRTDLDAHRLATLWGTMRV